MADFIPSWFKASSLSTWSGRATLIALLTAVGVVVFYSEPSQSLPVRLGAYSGFTRPIQARPFKIYMYDLPAHLSHDVFAANYSLGWSPAEYDASTWVYRMLRDSPQRTYNPDDADLFYVPIFPTRLLHLKLANMSWQAAVQESVHYMAQALELVQSSQPYWQRSNGFDHFTTITADAARCIHISSATRNTAGDMWFLQHHGSLHQYDFENGEFACYRPERDILLPAYVPGLTGVPAQRKNRKPSIIYRFSHETHTAGQKTHNVYVRKALWKAHQEHPIPGADWRVRNLNDTIKDMAESTFCVSPPGIAQHTSRFYRALRLGCIPITFFRGYNLPFQDKLDYSAFTINIQPGSTADLGWRSAEILENPKKLKSMQQALDKVQDAFLWQIQAPPIGVHALLLDALQDKAEKVRLLRSYCDPPRKCTGVTLTSNN